MGQDITSIEDTIECCIKRARVAMRKGNYKVAAFWITQGEEWEDMLHEERALVAA